VESFTFYNPTRVHFGKGMVSMLGKELREAGIGKCLLIAGGGSIRTNGVYADVTASLKEYGITWREGWGVRANPTLSKARELIELARSEQAEAILAIGGGSVIDTSKAVSAGYYMDDVWQMFTGKAFPDKALPLYVVLTLSATGSEMNSFAVLTNTETRQKWGTGHPLLFPRVTIIDPAYQSSLPQNQTVNGALDATAHILEYYFAAPASLVTRSLDSALLRDIVSMTDRLVADPQDYVARANLAWSATLALNGLSGAGMKGGDWACHSIEHAFSALHPEIAHGEGLGVIFPVWIEFMAERHPETIDRWAMEVWGEDSIAMAVKRFRSKIKEWGSASSLRDLGIRQDELPILLDLIMTSLRVGGISRFTREDVEALLLLAF